MGTVHHNQPLTKWPPLSSLVIRAGCAGSVMTNLARVQEIGSSAMQVMLSMCSLYLSTPFCWCLDTYGHGHLKLFVCLDTTVTSGCRLAMNEEDSGPTGIWWRGEWQPWHLSQYFSSGFSHQLVLFIWISFIISSHHHLINVFPLRKHGGDLMGMALAACSFFFFFTGFAFFFLGDLFRVRRACWTKAPGCVYVFAMSILSMLLFLAVCFFNACPASLLSSLPLCFLWARMPLGHVRWFGSKLCVSWALWKSGWVDMMWNTRVEIQKHNTHKDQCFVG